MKKQPHKIIEIIGPAGAGKTSLTKKISANISIKIVNEGPYYRQLRDLPFFIKNSLSILPTFGLLFAHKHSDWFTMEQIAWMVSLQGWHERLVNKNGNSDVIVLDEGPIYYMAYLLVYGPNVLRSSYANKWWQSIYQKYAEIFNAVIFLDSPNPILIKRIRARKTWHGVKKKSDQDSSQYLNDLRETYKKILSSLENTNKNPRVYHFDTEKDSYEQILRQIKSEMTF